MRIGAVIATTIDLIDKVLHSNKTTRNQLKDYIKKNKYIGAKDRRLLYSLVFSTLKKYYGIKEFCKNKAISETTRNFTLINYLNIYKPISINDIYEGKYSIVKEKEDKNIFEAAKSIKSDIIPKLPCWIEKKIFTQNKSDIKKIYMSILYEPKFDLAINRLDYNREKIIKKLQNLNIKATKTKFSPSGITLEKRIPENKLKKIKKNFFEVQDEGSQIMTLLANAKTNNRILDYCAGKGTKTIFLKNNFNNLNNLYAYDISRERLAVLKKRLTSLKIKNVTILPSTENYKNYFDLVICDVPCSSSGVWRRRPENILHLSESKLNKLILEQEDILNRAAVLCNENGELVYITCSLIIDENEKQIHNFLKKNNKFKLINLKERWNKIFKNNNLITNSKWFTLSPNIIKTDSYFISILKKIK